MMYFVVYHDVHHGTKITRDATIGLSRIVYVYLNVMLFYKTGELVTKPKSHITNMNYGWPRTSSKGQGFITGGVREADRLFWEEHNETTDRQGMTTVILG